MLDFLKAFDRVDATLLLEKMAVMSDQATQSRQVPP